MSEDACFTMVPVIAILGGFALAIFGMYFKFRTRQKFFQEREKLIDAMRETGNIDLEKIEVLHSPELEEKYLKDYTRGDKKANFKAGIILLAVSVALWLILRFVAVESEGEPPAVQIVGLAPALLGIAFLFIHYTCQPKNGNNNK